MTATSKIHTLASISTFHMMLEDLYQIWSLELKLDDENVNINLIGSYLKTKGYNDLPCWTEADQLADFEPWQKLDGGEWCDGVNSMANYLNAMISKEKFIERLSSYLKHIQKIGNNQNSLK